MTEGGYDAVGDNRPEIGRDAGERIEADRSLDVGRVYVDEVLGAGFGNMRKHVFCKIAVRVEQCQALTGQEVLPDQVEKQSALAGAGLSDDVEVPAALLGIEHDGLVRDAGADAKLLC